MYPSDIKIKQNGENSLSKYEYLGEYSLVFVIQIYQTS